MKMRIIASGTFDRLHEGHKFFLRKALTHGFVMIAITSDAMLEKKKHASLIYPYRRRRRDVVDFLKSEGKIEKKDYLIKKIHDKYGFATKIRNVDAIIVTRETERNALLINHERRKRGWHPLYIIKLPYLKDEKGIISSTRLRISDAKTRSHES
jgi:cytidyltransferase-like protein